MEKFEKCLNASEEESLYQIIEIENSLSIEDVLLMPWDSAEGTTNPEPIIKHYLIVSSEDKDGASSVMPKCPIEYSETTPNQSVNESFQTIPADVVTPDISSNKLLVTSVPICLVDSDPLSGREKVSLIAEEEPNENIPSCEEIIQHMKKEPQFGKKRPLPDLIYMPQPSTSSLSQQESEIPTPVSTALIFLKNPCPQIENEANTEPAKTLLINLRLNSKQAEINDIPSIHSVKDKVKKSTTGVIKKESFKKSDLATSVQVDEAPVRNVKIPKKEPRWCDVGIIKNRTRCQVTSFVKPAFLHDPDHPNITSNNLPDFNQVDRVELEPGTAYKFRICAINSFGRGPWSEVSAFRTALPGKPECPSNIRIHRNFGGINLFWDPPSSSGNIIEYSVYLGMKCIQKGPQGQKISFLKVYCGPNEQAFVKNDYLNMALIDQSDTSKPAIIFRIAARNENGYGDGIQVRWMYKSAA